MPIDPNDLNLPPETDLSDVAEEGNLVSQALNVPTDMTKHEKIRVTALMMAINYHRETIVHDPGMYQQLKMDNKILSPTTAHKVVAQAATFDLYLRGGYDPIVADLVKDDAKTTVDEGELAETIRRTADDIFGPTPDDENEGRSTEQP